MKMLFLIGCWVLVLNLRALAAEPAEAVAEASSSTPGFVPAGALDKDRFSVEPDRAWKGQQGNSTWWWEVRFPSPREVGAILQIQGDHPTVLHNAPKRYVWRASTDGKTWQNLHETATQRERRLYRIHRLNKPVRASHLQLHVFEATDELPTLREVEFYADPAAAIPFPEWVVAVSSTEDSTLPAAGGRFIRLARSCPGGEQLQAQEVWLDSFNEAFVAAEPRPLCAFFTGTIIDWCQVTRETWRGPMEVLKHRNLPIWAACGGAQAFAILEDVGVDRPWDCPHCRDPKNPKLRIYTHIGHTAQRPCGDYSCCIGERGAYNVRQSARDPVFQGMADEFKIMESHVGQIEYLPEGWTRIATKGTGGKTPMQCMRVKDRYIYAAQFHMEKDGTPETSRAIMSNFLRLAREWGGYNPKGRPVPLP